MVDIHLEIFEGPLDLLLHLIKKNDLNIYDIPISQITQEYLEYLELMKDLNLEVAGDFLVMASTLLQIKAKMLLPTPPSEEEEGPDPRQELVERLLEYQKYKQAAHFLQGRYEQFKDIHYRETPRFKDEEKVLAVNLFELLEALKEALENAQRVPQEIAGEEFPIEEKVQKILFLLDKAPLITLREIFRGEYKRLGVIACFLALLELVKTGKIFCRQKELFGEVQIFKKETALASA
ncbi:MAG: segregation/condensation protein A [Elusimicrobia bacterium]|nr:segregation/condensation protein A [Elusimicrobiota bacterium]